MNYKVDHIPRGKKRPAYFLDWQYITIHNTGNPKSTARSERNWLTNPKNTTTTGYHIVVDEHVAIECIPLHENAWHAGDGRNGPGNRKSIGIEICESGNLAANIRHAIEVVVYLLKSSGKDASVLRQHHDWSGKNCPRLIRAGIDGWTWTRFVRAVEKELSKNMSKHFKDLSADHWGAPYADYLYEQGVLVGRGDGTLDPDTNITRLEAAVLIAKAMQQLKGDK